MAKWMRARSNETARRVGRQATRRTQRRESQWASEHGHLPLVPRTWLDAFANGVSDLITVHDQAGNIVYVTPSVLRFVGATDSVGVTGLDALEVVHPDDRQILGASFAAWARGDTTEVVRYRVRHSDGSWREMEGLGRRFPADVGGGGVVVTSRDCTVSDQQARERFLSELLLQRGIEQHEFVVYYQPEIDVASGELVGFEALARWQDPSRGLITPDGFIDLAESTGLIIPLGRQILRLACQQLADVHATMPAGSNRPWVSVNLSGRQLDRPEFVDDVAAVLADTGLDPDLLWLEITETMLMDDIESSRLTLLRLRSLGVHLAIDDFGTGWSSLAHLKRFPVEQLKIDRSFTAGVGRDAEDTSIITAIIAMAHSLGISVVAEGVETTVQLAALADLRCDVGQGYLWSRPMPADELTTWTTRCPNAAPALAPVRALRTEVAALATVAPRTQRSV